jgi:hypothetical protein
MRMYAFVISATAVILILPASAYARNAQCEELRLACEHKDALGEQGAGDCRTYRETCQRWRCGQLRYWCLHKDQFGGEGQGYCQSYREMCSR